MFHFVVASNIVISDQSKTRFCGENWKLQRPMYPLNMMLLVEKNSRFPTLIFLYFSKVLSIFTVTVLERVKPEPPKEII